ncbi:glutamate receptor ionotropic, kainate glr-3-like [Panulirus ornatus]|uniref:glutamate receptor ionotropic, kainate glr-3-like n=1 Tax=Panulirus ornatus TaxID=150431 RepID=UPI003A8BE698
MVGVPLTIDDVRAAAIDFSTPVFMDRLVASYSRPTFESDLAAFVKPYTALMWLLLLLTMLVVFFWIFIVQRLRSLFLSRYGTGEEDLLTGEGNIYRSVDVRALEGGQCDHIMTTVWTSFLWTLTAPLAQSSSWWPKGGSLRVITGLWLLMSFIVGTVYRSNLKAMLIIPKLHLPFNSVQELLETDIPAYMPAGSLIHQLMREAPVGSSLHQLRQRSVLHFDLPRAIRDTLDGKHAGIASLISLTGVMNDIFSKCAASISKDMNTPLQKNFF